ncbi:hypothetical protein DMUE_0028 [Dictyocoela muelleri]|nr:hypothetical protein DMUE_0028 [Dictyocoela muelleri]
MTMTFSINGENEKNELIQYLITKKYPENINKSYKRKLFRMSRYFSVKNNNLYIKDNSVEKLFICSYEDEKMREIIMNEHNQDHARARSIFERIRVRVYGISLSDVINVIKNCENCMRERQLKF